MPLTDLILNTLIEGLGEVGGARRSYAEAPEWVHGGQRAAWGSRALEVVTVAGTQGGKTALQAPWMLREVQRCAPLIRMWGRGKVIYCGPTITLLAEQALPGFQDLFEDQEQLGKLLQGTKPRFRFSKQGLARVLGFCDCPVTVSFAYATDSSNLESMTAMAGVWDEAGQKENKEASYRAFNRRLKAARSTTFGDARRFLQEHGLEQSFDWWIRDYFEAEGPEGRFGRRLWGTTPYEWGWFKTAVVDRALALEAGFAHFNFPSWMNPHVSEAECRAELENGMDLWDWEMKYLGQFRRPAGRIYPGFDAENRVSPFEIPRNWRRFVGMDFGNVNTAAVLLAEDPDSRDLYVFAEYKRDGSSFQGSNPFQEHAATLKRLAGGTPTGAGGSHQEEGWREAMRRHGLPLEEPPIHDVETQIACVIALVNTKRLKVFESCSRLIAQFEGYSRELDDTQQPIEGTIRDKAKYHYLDALRYIVAKVRPVKGVVAKAAARREPLVHRHQSEFV